MICKSSHSVFVYISHSERFLETGLHIIPLLAGAVGLAATKRNSLRMWLVVCGWTCLCPPAGLPCFQTQPDLKDLLETLGQNVGTKKRKNVEILWLAGAVRQPMSGDSPLKLSTCDCHAKRFWCRVCFDKCGIEYEDVSLSEHAVEQATEVMWLTGSRPMQVAKVKSASTFVDATYWLVYLSQTDMGQDVDGWNQVSRDCITNRTLAVCRQGVFTQQSHKYFFIRRLWSKQVVTVFLKDYWHQSAGSNCAVWLQLRSQLLGGLGSQSRGTVPPSLWVCCISLWHITLMAWSHSIFLQPDNGRTYASRESPLIYFIASCAGVCHTTMKLGIASLVGLYNRRCVIDLFYGAIWIIEEV